MSSAGRTGTCQMRAFIDDPDNVHIANIVHSNAGAQQFGFRAALVRGTTVYGWAVPAIVQALGTEWLESGWSAIGFRAPVHPGDDLTSRVSEGEGGACGLIVSNQDGVRCAAGSMSLGPAPWLSELRSSLRRTAEPKPASVPALTLESAPVGRDLRPLGARMGEDEARGFAVEELGESDPLWVGSRPRIHPAWLAFRVWPLLRQSVGLGPLLHTQSRVQHLAPAYAGQTVTTTGRLVEAYERKGHHYAVVDGAVLAESGEELARFRHTFIFRIGPLG